ncbi:metal ABC transporter solute-binding protein, Zn/Mn family [Asaia sp. HN010]|uniref:metal ABC transporter solute-binding protein, Zn/Mn family n=1 Tax=Asaia sp. HN010 TaxID=3081233 RepID=UPI00301B5096
MRQTLFLLICFLTLLGSARAEPVRIFCAEALWCDLAGTLGGSAVSTTSILTSPRIDPHDFQVTPDMARKLADSNIVLMMGGHYDDWVPPLLAAQPSTSRHVISVASLAGLGPTDNPHLFDDPEAVRRMIAALSTELAARLPGDAAAIGARQSDLNAMIAALADRLKKLRPQTQGMKIAVAEPVGGPLLQALGIEVIDPEFAMATMNHDDPAPRDVARLEDALRENQVRILIVNPAVRSPSLARIEALARKSHVAVVSFDEFPESGQLWQDWMKSRLDRLVAALGIHG